MYAETVGSTPGWFTLPEYPPPKVPPNDGGFDTPDGGPGTNPRPAPKDPEDGGFDVDTQ